MKALISVLLLAVACSCPSKPAATSATAPGSGQAATPDPAGPGSAATDPTGPGSAATDPTGPGSGTAPDPTTQNPGSAAEPQPSWPKGGPGMGESCGPNDACAQGLTCVSYYGIAGARGPEFKSCEIKCGDGTACPAGTKCITIADGPGQVCRK